MITRFHWLFAAVFSCLLFVSNNEAHSATIIEDFNYSAGNFGTANGGGSGWNGSWGSVGGTTGTLRVLAQNLSYSGGGYNITQTGTGLASGTYQPDFRGMNRDFSTAMSGTIWFSVLVSNTGAVDRTGIQFNNARGSNLDYNPSSFFVALNGTSLEVAWGSSATVSTAATGLALNTTHLLVGRIDVSAGNDTLQLWVNSPNLANPGTPTFTTSAADLGATLTSTGIFAYGTAGGDIDYGRVDALRVSDGNGNSSTGYFAVTGVNLVPEPQRAVLSALALSLLVFRRQR